MGQHWSERIIVNPKVCHGTACVKGTRIPASVILDNLAAEISEREIRGQYPTLSPDDIQAALAYAAEVTGYPLYPVCR